MSDELWRQYADVLQANAELGSLVVDLRARLAEAEALLREVNTLVLFTTGAKVIGGTLGKRIDAFLTRADQPPGVAK